MSSNQTLLQKADAVLADIASAGKLTPEQANRFVKVMIDQPTILGQVRTVTMNSSQMNINKIGFGSRIMRPAVENTALSSGDRSKPTFSQVALTTKEMIAEVRLPYAMLEDNIEGGNPLTALQQGAGGLHQTIVDLMAERAALDLEEYALLGDTASGDAYLAQADGYLKLATANGVDALAATYSKDIVKAAIKAMPDKYLRDRANMVHTVCIDNETEMRDTYANRQTAMGDQQVQGNLPLYVFGSKVQGAALMPAAQSLFGNMQNLIFGIQRNISMEYDKDITTRQFIIVLTVRCAVQIEEVNALVKVTNIG